jgi:hypothetical protein
MQLTKLSAAPGQTAGAASCPRRTITAAGTASQLIASVRRTQGGAGVSELKYEAIPRMSVQEIEAALVRDRPEELLIAVLAAALYSDDPAWAEGICKRLARHQHFAVRGNAILGFGHLARIHRRLDKEAVLPIIRNGLCDPHEYVRGHSDSAADDVEQYLGWHVGIRPCSPAS